MRARSWLAAMLLASTAITASPGLHAQAPSPAQKDAPAWVSGPKARPTVDDPVIARREYEIASKLRCLVCQNESIAESRAPLAVDLRTKVREQVAAGRSDEEIIAWMTARYGEFVLYQPPLRAATVPLWFGPFALLLAGGLIAWRVVRARRAIGSQPPLSDDDRARAAELLRGGEKVK